MCAGELPVTFGSWNGSVHKATKIFHCGLARVLPKQCFDEGWWMFSKKFGRDIPVPTTNTIKNIHRKVAESGTLEDEARSGRPRCLGSHENLDWLHQSTRRSSLVSSRSRGKKQVFHESLSGVYCETICKRIHTGQKLCNCSPKRIRRCDKCFARKCLRSSKTMQLSSISSSLLTKLTSI